MPVVNHWLRTSCANEKKKKKKKRGGGRERNMGKKEI